MSLTSCDSLLRAAPLPMLLVMGTERIAAANEPAERVFGKSILTRHYIAALRHPGLLDCIETVLRGEGDSAQGLYPATEAMRDVTYRVTAARVSVDGAPGVLVTLEDITEMQEAGQMRRDFVANVSHELRTPLTALLGFIETLRGPARDDPAARERFLGIMEAEATRMTRLVRDLLSLSRVESQQRIRPQTPVDCAGIVRSAVSTLRPLADSAGLALDLVGLDAPAELPGDPDQLGQVVSNLLENAIKYAAGGTRIEVALERRDHDPSVRGPAVAIIVSDDGEGIDPLHIPRLTERFYRVDSHRSREKGGTGLGLAIVKHVVTRHRGRLRIRSAPGEGSRFEVILPTQ